MPNGLVNPRGTLTAFMRKPLAESLREIGVTPENIGYFAMSHSHGDHSGNANMFNRSTIYMQAAEYDAIHGVEPLFVRLPKTGPVLLSGDFVHLRSNWEAKRVPSINFNVEQSSRSMLEMESFIKATGAQLWINHDAEQSRTVPKAPAFVE